MAIVAIALGAGLKAAGALIDNAQRLADVSAAQWCADNQLTVAEAGAAVPAASATPTSPASSSAAATAAAAVAADAESELPPRRCADCSDDAGRPLVTLVDACCPRYLMAWPGALAASRWSRCWWRW